VLVAVVVRQMLLVGRLEGVEEVFEDLEVECTETCCLTEPGEKSSKS